MGLFDDYGILNGLLNFEQDEIKEGYDRNKWLEAYQNSVASFKATVDSDDFKQGKNGWENPEDRKKYIDDTRKDIEALQQGALQQAKINELQTISDDARLRQQLGENTQNALINDDNSALENAYGLYTDTVLGAASNAYDQTFNQGRRMLAELAQITGNNNYAAEQMDKTLQRQQDFAAMAKPAEFDTENFLSLNNIRLAIDSTAQQAALIGSPVNRGVYKIAGAAASGLGKVTGLTPALEKFFGAAAGSGAEGIAGAGFNRIIEQGILHSTIKEHAKAAAGYLMGKTASAIPTWASVSLPELYSEDISYDENGNVVLPSSDRLWTKALFAIPHAIMENYGINPTKFGSTIERLSFRKYMQEYSNSVLGELFGEVTQHFISLVENEWGAVNPATGKKNDFTAAVYEAAKAITGNSENAKYADMYKEVLGEMFGAGVGALVMFPFDHRIATKSYINAHKNLNEQLDRLINRQDAQCNLLEQLGIVNFDGLRNNRTALEQTAQRLQVVTDMLDPKAREKIETKLSEINELLKNTQAGTEEHSRLNQEKNQLLERKNAIQDIKPEQIQGLVAEKATLENNMAAITAAYSDSVEQAVTDYDNGIKILEQMQQDYNARQEAMQPNYSDMGQSMAQAMAQAQAMNSNDYQQPQSFEEAAKAGNVDVSPYQKQINDTIKLAKGEQQVIDESPLLQQQQKDIQARREKDIADEQGKVKPKSRTAAELARLQKEWRNSSFEGNFNDFLRELDKQEEQQAAEAAAQVQVVSEEHQAARESKQREIDAAQAAADRINEPAYEQLNNVLELQKANATSQQQAEQELEQLNQEISNLTQQKKDLTKTAKKKKGKNQKTIAKEAQQKDEINNRLKEAKAKQQELQDKIQQHRNTAVSLEQTAKTHYDDITKNNARVNQLQQELSQINKDFQARIPKEGDRLKNAEGWYWKRNENGNLNPVREEAAKESPEENEAKSLGDKVFVTKANAQVAAARQLKADKDSGKVARDVTVSDVYEIIGTDKGYVVTRRAEPVKQHSFKPRTKTLSGESIISKAEVDSVVQAVKNNIKKDFDLNIVVVEDQTELPEGTYTQSIYRNAAGVWTKAKEFTEGISVTDEDTNTVYIVRNNIPSVKRLKQVLNHEILAHMGIRNILNQKQQQYILHEIDRMLKEDESFRDAIYPEIAMYLQDNQNVLLEEVLARIAEHIDDGNVLTRTAKRIWDNIVSVVYKALRHLGLTTNMSRAELNQLLRGMRNDLTKTGDLYHYSKTKYGEKAGAKAMFSAENMRKAIEKLSNGDQLFRYDIDGKPMASVATYYGVDKDRLWMDKEHKHKSGRLVLKEFLEKAEKSGELEKGTTQSMLSTLDTIADACLYMSQEFPNFANWCEATVEYDEEGKPYFTVVRQNGDYAMNIDFSTVCKKRRFLNVVINSMVEKGMLDNHGELTDKDIVNMQEIIKQHGFEVACALCFVDSKRYNIGSQAKNVSERWNNMYQSMLDGTDYYKETLEKAKYKKDLSERRALIKEFEKKTFAKKNPDIKRPTFTPEEMEKNGKNWAITTNLNMEDKIALALDSDPKYRFKLDEDWLLSSGNNDMEGGHDYIAKNFPRLYEVLRSTGAGRPKDSHLDVPWNNDIIQKINAINNAANKASFDRKKAYSIGGVRIQSFSDYIATNFFDYVQCISELAAKGLPCHCYTKEADFVKLFGQCNLKMNMSLVYGVELVKNEKGEEVETENAGGKRISKAEYDKLDDAHKTTFIDDDGTLVYYQYIYMDEDPDHPQTFNPAEAFALREDPRFRDNVGTIAVGVSDDHIKALLADPRIDMVIPYHKSGIKQDVAKGRHILKYKDYSAWQNTTTSKLKQGRTADETAEERAARQAEEEKKNAEKAAKGEEVKDTNAASAYTKLDPSAMKKENPDFEDFDFYSLLFTNVKSKKKKVQINTQTVAYYRQYMNKNGLEVNENLLKGKKDSDLLDPRLACDAYVKWCEKWNLKPKFDKFVNNPNYYKLIIDYKVFVRDSQGNEIYVPQKDVRLKLDDTVVGKNADGSDKTQWQQDLQKSLKVDQELMDRFDREEPAILEDIQNKLAENKANRESNNILNKAKGKKGKVNLPAVDPSVELPAKKGKKSVTRFSLRSVEPVYPSSSSWYRGKTLAEYKKLGYPIYETVPADVLSEEQRRAIHSKGGASGTANTSTKTTYTKLFSWLKEQYPDKWQNMRILDASSGLGQGTVIGQDMGFNVTDVEPFVSDTKYGRKAGDRPAYEDYDKLEKDIESGKIEKFDFIISNAVLNVLPQDERDNMTTALSHLVKDGGQIFFNVISKDYQTAKDAKEPVGRNDKGQPYWQLSKSGNPTGSNLVTEANGDTGREIFVWSSNSPQKVFSKPELTAYLKDVMGDNITVSTSPKGIGMTAVIVTKGKSGADNNGKTMLKGTNGKKSIRRSQQSLDAKYMKAVEDLGDTEELRNILQTAKGNGTLGKAPNGEQSNLEPAQWLMVRTRNFKRWFGNWNYDPNTKVNAVDLTDYEFTDKDGNIIHPQTSKELKEWFKDYIKDFPVKINSDGNLVFATMGKFGDSLKRRNRKGQEVQRDAYKALKAIIENAVYYSFEGNDGQSKHKGLLGQDIYYSAIKYGDKIYSIRLKLDASTDGDTYKDHKIREVNLSVFHSTEDKSNYYARSKFTSDLSITQLIQDVNPNEISKVVDENGEPLVALHGSHYNNIKEYDPSETSSDKISHGIWFSDSKSVSEDVYAKVDENDVFKEFKNPKVYNNFLNIKNPLIVDCKNKAWNQIPIEGFSLKDQKVLLNTKYYTKKEWQKDETNREKFVPNAIKSRNIDYKDARWGMTEGEARKKYGIDTEEVVLYAKSNGYDGVIFKNIIDGTIYSVPSTTYAVLDSSQAKLAELTRDDADNVIPLSQRFNTGKKDIRYSKQNYEQMYFDQQRQFAEKVQAIRDKEIALSKKSLKEKLKHNIDAMANMAEYKWVNRRHYLQKWQEEITAALADNPDYADYFEDGRLRDEYDPMLLWDTVDGKIQTKRDNFVKKYWDRFYDMAMKSGIKYEDLNRYLVARHAAERDEYIAEINPKFDVEHEHGSGWNDDWGTPEQFVKDCENKYKGLRDAAALYDEMNKALILRQVEYKLMSEEAAQKILGRYEHYTPLKRLDDELMHGADVPHQDININQNVDHRALGRQSEPEHTITFAKAAIDTVFRRGERNIIKLAMLNLALGLNDPSIQINRELVKRELVDGEVVYVPDRNNDNEQTIYVREGDKRYRIHFDNTELYTAFVNDGATNGLFQALTKSFRGLTASMGLNATARNIEFGLVNLDKDQQQALSENLVYRSKNGGFWHFALAALKNVPSAMRTFIRYQLSEKGTNFRDTTDIEEFEEFLENGGSTGYMDIYRLVDDAKDLEAHIDESTLGIAQRIKKWSRQGKLMDNARRYAKEGVALMLAPLELINDMFEQATRFSNYKAAKQAGMSPARAAELAKNLTLNFNRHGAMWTAEWNWLYMFSNASLQGTSKTMKLYRRAVGKDSPARTAARALIGTAFTAGFMSEILNHILSPDDDDDKLKYYDKLDASLKDNHVIVINPAGEGTYVKIPLAIPLAVPYMIARNAAAAMLGTQSIGESTTNILSNIMDYFSPVGTDNNKNIVTRLFKMGTPTSLRPFVDIATNSNFAGNKIRNESYGSSKPAYMRAMKKTPVIYVELCKILSDITGGNQMMAGTIDLAPEDVQHIVESYTGGTGKFFGRGLDTAQKLLSGEPVNTNNIPIVRRFAGEDNDSSVYDEFNTNKTLYSSLIAARKSKDTGFLSLYPQYKSFIKGYERYSDRLKALDKRLKAGKISDNAYREEKINVMKHINAAVRDYSKK